MPQIIECARQSVVKDLLSVVKDPLLDLVRSALDWTYHILGRNTAKQTHKLAIYGKPKPHDVIK